MSQTSRIVKYEIPISSATREEADEPELPDVLCYVDALNDTHEGHEIVAVSVCS